MVGEITRVWNRVGPMIRPTIKQRSFTQTSTRILPTDPEVWPRLRGAIARVAQKQFTAPQLMQSRYGTN